MSHLILILLAEVLQKADEIFIERTIHQILKPFGLPNLIAIKGFFLAIPAHIFNPLDTRDLNFSGRTISHENDRIVEIFCSTTPAN